MNTPKSESPRGGRSTGAGLPGISILTLILVAYAGGIGFSTVWLRYQISVTANNNKTLDLQITDVQRRVDSLKADISAAESTSQLLAQNIALGINLVRPREDQVIRTTIDVERRLAAKRFGQLFSDAMPSVGAPSVAGD